MLHAYRRKPRKVGNEANMDGGLLGRWGVCHISEDACVGLAGIMFSPTDVRRHKDGGPVRILLTPSPRDLASIPGRRVGENSEPTMMKTVP